MSNSPALTITPVTGEAIRQYIDDLAHLRIEVFREFPYLYDGDLDYEQRYLETYINSPRAVVVLAKADDQIVGASTALPLADETTAFRKPFEEQGWDIARIFYFAESVIKKDYRGGGTGAKFFASREAHAKLVGDFNVFCFAAVDRPADHPRRPASYRTLDAFWQRLGYVKHPELKMTLSWKDLDNEVETPKTLTFWVKTT